MAEAEGASWKAWLLEGKDEQLLEGMGWFLLLLGAFVALLGLLKVEVPYGRYGNNGGLLSYLLLTNLKMPAKLGWFLMEMPSFAVPTYLVLNVGGKYVGQVNPNIVLLGMFILHYFNR